VSQNSYAAAGVDIDAQDRAIALIRQACRSTYRPEVVTDVGAFGGMWALDLTRCSQPVLVSSIDGVGTKVKVAAAAGSCRSVGIDLVNHCLNDIGVMGAEPLFFLDYIGTGKLAPERVAEVVEGLAEACRAAGCALIGGEMAEMPGLYAAGDFDLVGCIVGLVDRAQVVDGRRVAAGDAVVGFASSGLHTNGYSLARRVLFEQAGLGLDDRPAGLETTVGEALLRPHVSYLPALRALREAGLLRAAAHITGGGLRDNLPRVLPAGLGAELWSETWTEPPIFALLRQAGAIAEAEMHRAFNCGLGLLAVVSPDELAEALRVVADAGQPGLVVGRIDAGDGVRVVRTGSPS